MATTLTLLTAPSLSRALAPLTTINAERPVRGVRVVESLEGLQASEEGELVVLGSVASREAATYQFEIALRLAASSELAGIVLMGDEPVQLTEAAAAIAARAGIAVLQARKKIELTALVLAIYSELSGDAESGLARAHDVLIALVAAEKDGAGPDELMSVAEERLGTEIVLREPQEGDLYAPVIVDGRTEESLCASNAGPTERATELVLHIAAAVVARAITVTRLAEESPIQSRAELLAELLSSDAQRAGSLMHRARSLGLAVDGWHVAVQIEVENAAEISGGDELAASELVRRLARLALEVARARGGSWHRAGVGVTLRLVRMDRDDPGPSAAPAAADVADRILRRLQTRIPELVLRCGIGGSHAGFAGLRTTAAEATAAVAAARLAGRAGEVVLFDEVGLRRTLIEWYASDAAREAVQTVLEPLERLGSRRGAEAIKTLEAYLGYQGSVTRTAEALHLHRNAVSYRIKRIVEQLNVDLEDPEQRLLVELACRARALR